MQKTKKKQMTIGWGSENLSTFQSHVRRQMMHKANENLALGWSSFEFFILRLKSALLKPTEKSILQ